MFRVEFSEYFALFRYIEAREACAGSSSVRLDWIYALYSVSIITLRIYGNYTESCIHFQAIPLAMEVIITIHSIITKKFGIKFTSESSCKPVWHSHRAVDVTMCITVPERI